MPLDPDKQPEPTWQDQLDELRQEMQRHYRLLSAENADLRRTLSAVGIEPPASRLAGERWLTPKQYAAEQHITYPGVIKRIERGQVHAEKDGKGWLIRVDV